MTRKPKPSQPSDDEAPSLRKGAAERDLPPTKNGTTTSIRSRWPRLPVSSTRRTGAACRSTSWTVRKRRSVRRVGWCVDTSMVEEAATGRS